MPSKDRKKSKQVYVTDEKMWDALRELALQRGTSLSSELMDAVEEHLIRASKGTIEKVELTINGKMYAGLVRLKEGAN